MNKIEKGVEFMLCRLMEQRGESDIMEMWNILGEMGYSPKDRAEISSLAKERLISGEVNLDDIYRKVYGCDPIKNKDGKFIKQDIKPQYSKEELDDLK